ncbi:U8-theraphotoxin-Hhn1e-like [Centruroides sculpturatus]|uniref:U8-theraphotoxin-Hhn1e-like n=1 Tax=Centruroides sculpturatus TaxID=218467 RepID=UPI000C6EDE96|nr:U8-theraphotoxin-Hhn1e-like [Centruroides sculpturatus]
MIKYLILLICLIIAVQAIGDERKICKDQSDCKDNQCCLRIGLVYKCMKRPEHDKSCHPFADFDESVDGEAYKRGCPCLDENDECKMGESLLDKFPKCRTKK